MTLCLLLTQSGHRPDRNPAVQWSPGLGKIGEDGIERVTTQTVFDILEVLSSRGAGACQRVAKLMTELGWSAVRVCGLTRDGYREQVRGYCRDVRYGCQST